MSNIQNAQLVPSPTEPHRPDRDWKPLYLFNIYRLVLSSIFLLTFVTGTSPSFLGRYDPETFLIANMIYWWLAIIFIFTIEQRWLNFYAQVLVHVLVDIFIISILMYSSGGLGSGVGMLLVVAIAAASLLTEGRTAFFFAAIASIAVLLHVTLADVNNWYMLTTNYTHAGLLGISFFATAFLAHSLAQRIRASETLAKQRGLHVQYLAELNQEIVQHIQSGIVVIDMLGRIRLCNHAALRLLNLHDDVNGLKLYNVAAELAERLLNWQRSSKTEPQLFRPNQGEVDVLASFTELSRGHTDNILIVLEDATVTAQRAQQLKLASLGRLTASIAHEIRNPLSAINHAGQLLAEQELTDEQRKLMRIIDKQSKRVNRIIQNVLQLSRRSEANDVALNLPNWVRNFIEELTVQHSLNPKDIELNTDSNDLQVCFDPEQLYQVINNLCDNGLRYSQRQPRLTLTIGTTPELNRPFLDVRDYGQGMTTEVAKQIFEPFFTTEIRGTGLGLYLAREICEGNRAALHMLMNSREGCCFRVYFTAALEKTA